MAVVVRREKDGETFVVVGAGLSASQHNPLFSQNVSRMLCICDKSGDLYWVPTTELTVVEVDGLPPAEVLKER